jgi:Zn-finger nucleic acid-binding protein
MQCPVCNAELRQTDLGEYGLVVLDVCPQCQGIWFDKGELDRLDGSVWVNVEEHTFHEVEGDHKKATCPRCNVSLEPLSPHDVEDLIVDRCPSCEGFWLDKGELARIGDVADQVHAELAEKATPVQKPLNWSWIRWAAYNLKKYYFDKK